MSRLFISYSRDDRPLAEKLFKGLSALGHEVWWDDHLEGGDEFRRTIGVKLSAAAAVLVIWSPKSVNSRWVLDEADKAFSDSKLIPVRFSKDFDIPMGFGQLHVEDLSNWDGSSAAPAIKALDEKIDAIEGGRFRETIMAIGGRTLEGKLTRNEALGLFQQLDVSVGGVPIGRFVMGVIGCAFLATVVTLLGEGLGGRFNLLDVSHFIVWAVVFFLARGALQFVLLSKGRSARRFFDESFSFWLLFSATVALTIVLVFLALDSPISLAEFVMVFPVITAFPLLLVITARAIVSGAMLLARRI